MKIYVVGIGPGNKIYMTGEAISAIKESDVVVGYNVYVELIKDMLEGKAIISNGMKKETERVALAIEEAKKGQTVSVISSGDAGIYGMAGLVYEMAAGSNIEVVVVAGITAAVSAAAAVGAPLMNDFAVISLSDLLTPWDKIEKRLKSAAEGDFVIALYNPSSKKRQDYLNKAVSIIMSVRDKKTACATAKNIGREGFQTEILMLDELLNKQVDMFTTVIIGNSCTEIISGKLVTKRGYGINE